MTEVIAARWGIDGASRDCTEAVRTFLRQGAQFVANNDLVGDPAYGIRKNLHIDYEDGSSRTYPEGSLVGLPLIAPTIHTLNLIYFICPLAFNRAQWEWNVDLVKSLARGINGKRILCVTQSKDTDNLDLVLQRFGDYAFHDVVVRQNTEAWEMSAFPKALRLVANNDSGEALVYAHAKGVRRTGAHLEAARIWTRVMGHFLLARPDKLMRVLGEHAAAGALKTDFGYWETDWHYYGNFWAVRHDQVPEEEWFPNCKEKYFIEFWLPRFVARENAATLCPVVYPYALQNQLDDKIWRSYEPRLEAAMAKWLRGE